MRLLATFATLAAAVGLLFPLDLLPDGQTAQIVGGFWGMFLGVCVIWAWAFIWTEL